MAQIRARVYAFWEPGTPLRLIRGPVVGMPENTYYHVSKGEMAEAVILPYKRPDCYGHPVLLDIDLFDEPRLVGEDGKVATAGEPEQQSA